MKISKTVIVSLLLSFVLSSYFCFAFTQTDANNLTLAQVTDLVVHQGSQRVIHPLSAQGILLVALRDCNLSAGGETLEVRRGEIKQIPGSNRVLIASTSNDPCRFVLINIREASQPLTIGSVHLQVAGEVHDASARNSTLLVALSPMQLEDQVNVGNEAEWTASRSRAIILLPGQSCWLKAGIHHIKNVRGQPARFIAVEW